MNFQVEIEHLIILSQMNYKHDLANMAMSILSVDTFGPAVTYGHQENLER